MNEIVSKPESLISFLNTRQIFNWRFLCSDENKNQNNQIHCVDYYINTAGLQIRLEYLLPATSANVSYFNHTILKTEDFYILNLDELVKIFVKVNDMKISDVWRESTQYLTG